MSSNGNYVAVSSLINPGEALSRSLTDLSSMYANQYSRKQEREIKRSQEERLNTTFNQQQDALGAKKELNNWAPNFNESDVTFDTSTMSGAVAESLLKNKQALESEQQELVARLRGETPETSVFEQNLKNGSKDVEKGRREVAISNRINDRNKALGSIRSELGGLEGEERESRIKYYADKMYGEDINALEGKIKTGTYLTRDEKLNQVIRNLPESITRNIPYNELEETINKRLTGPTLEEIKKQDRYNVDTVNEARKFNAGKDFQAYNSYVASKGNKNTAEWTSKDIVDYGKGLDGIDIGFYDNANAKEAANKLLAAGNHPLAVIRAIKDSISSGFDSTFFDSGAGTKQSEEQFSKLADLASKYTGKLTSNKNTGQTSYNGSMDFKYNPSLSRSADDIRIGKFNFDTGKRLSQFAPSVVQAVKDRVTQRTAGNQPSTPSSVPQSPMQRPTGPNASASDVLPAPAARQSVNRDTLPVPREGETSYDAALRDVVSGRLVVPESQDAKAVGALRGYLGDDYIKENNVLIDPNNGTWEERATAINNNSVLGSSFTISSRDMALAKGNPKMQKDLVDRANRVIANGILIDLKDQDIYNGVTDHLGNTSEAVGGWISDTFGSGMSNEDLAGVTSRRDNIERRRANNSDREKLLKNYLRERTGTNPDSLAGNYLNYSAEADFSTNLKDGAKTYSGLIGGALERLPYTPTSFVDREGQLSRSSRNTYAEKPAAEVGDRPIERKLLTDSSSQAKNSLSYQWSNGNREQKLAVAEELARRKRQGVNSFAETRFLNENSNVIGDMLTRPAPVEEPAPAKSRSLPEPAKAVSKPFGVLRDQGLPISREALNGNLPKSKRSVSNDPVVYHGESAVEAVEAMEGKLTPLESSVIMHEGYSPDVYADSKGIPTTGAGQTGEFMDASVKDTIKAKVDVAKRVVPKFDEYPLDMQSAILQAVYRGDAKSNHDWVKMLNSGDYEGASKELLNHDEYKGQKGKGANNGVTRRLEELSEVLKRRSET